MQRDGSLRMSLFGKQEVVTLRREEGDETSEHKSHVHMHVPGIMGIMVCSDNNLVLVESNHLLRKCVYPK